MSITRVTQNMIAQRSLSGMQTGLDRLARLQEQVSSGKVLTKPSDNPSDTAIAMTLRSSLVEVAQHVRNADDGKAWLARVDSTLQTMIDETRTARETAMSARGSVNPANRDALATQIEELRTSLISLANTQHMGRPVFGGHTPGQVAFGPDGTFVGLPGTVERVVAPGVSIRVDLDAETAVGPDGALFEDLAALADAVRAGDDAGIGAGLKAMDAGLDRLGTALVEVGTRAARLDRAAEATFDREVDLSASLGRVEDVDMPRALMEMKLQESAYQAALASTARVMQPSLLDFLR